MATKTVYDIPESSTSTVDPAEGRLVVTMMRIDDGSLVAYASLHVGGKVLESRVDALVTPAQNTTFENILKSLAVKVLQAKGGTPREVEVVVAP